LDEMEDVSPDRLQELKRRYPEIPIEMVSHSEMKELTKHSKGIIKTGDTCAYANLIVVSG
jgi:D-ribose pyranase